MAAMLLGASIPALPTAPAIIVSGGTNASTATPVTSLQTMVDSSAGGGILMPPAADATSYGTPQTSSWGLEAPQNLRLTNIGANPVTIYPALGDPNPAITTLPPFQCFDMIRGGAGGTVAAIRIW